MAAETRRNAYVPGNVLIAEERARQISDLGFRAHHDDRHTDGELVLAAVAYAAHTLATDPEDTVVCRDDQELGDPFPREWHNDARVRAWGTGEAVLAGSGEAISVDQVMSNKAKIRLLVKAGGLLCAEIDRLQRLDLKEETT